ncbi:hypothetical protein V9T40_004597 [Parthenolecanium corni]|uniref:Uncharacterized protein n=1 Tax=Parthenolecanium corni TaxID=536013 RepID=A0AAN9YAK3_9HEMI
MVFGTSAGFQFDTTLRREQRRCVPDKIRRAAEHATKNSTFAVDAGKLLLGSATRQRASSIQIILGNVARSAENSLRNVAVARSTLVARSPVCARDSKTRAAIFFTVTNLPIHQFTTDDDERPTLVPRRD